MAAQPRKLRKNALDLRDRRSLLDLNTASPEETAQARKIKEDALVALGISHSVVASWVYSKCYYQIPTTAIETMAVILLGDGSAMLAYNPHFTIALGVQGAEFVLFHEARHLMMRHLFTEPHLRDNQNWTLATEACINHVAKIRLGLNSMPTVHGKLTDEFGEVILDEVTGEPKMGPTPTGVDPDQVYKKYVQLANKANLAPVTREDFTRTDYACFTELERVNFAEESGQGGGKAGDMSGQCIHQGEDGDGDGVPMDSETLGEIGKDVLSTVLKEAIKGKESARKELLEIVDRTDGASDEITKMWGDLGVGRLRGETLVNRKVDWWQQWVQGALASKLKDGERLKYNKKRGAIDLMMGHDPFLSYCGTEEVKVVLVAIDTSGSMPQHVIDYLTKLVGQTDGVEFHWVSFDGVVMPFVAGEKVMGGGGTNFDNVAAYAEGRIEVNGYRMEQHPDVVLMVTDGYASPIRPAEPDKWVWLITEGGSDDWIRAQNDRMESYTIKTGDGL